MDLIERLGIAHSVLQAPMAGVSTPAMAAEVTRASGLGALGVGAMDAAKAGAAIAEVRARVTGPLNVNVFCHGPAVRDASREAAWCARLAPEFARFGAAPPERLGEIYRSFPEDGEMLGMLIAARPEVVSFHFGLPGASAVRALKGAGILLLASATSPAEARAAEAAGMDAVVAQGWEAGGHRGIFDPEGPDAQMGTFALVRGLVRDLGVPVIAAGGIMDGAGIAAALRLGAVAAQLGTAFVGCPESAASPAYRAALASPLSERTLMSAAISGRPARGLPTRLTEALGAVDPQEIPAYPVTYDAAKALDAAAKAGGEPGYGAMWAGQGAPLARALPAADLVATLVAEMG